MSQLAAGSGKVIPKGKISSLISEYGSCEGVEVVNIGSELIRDCVIYTPADCALICLFGNFSMDSIAKIVSND